MYALVEGKYWWMDTAIILSSFKIYLENDSENYEAQTDQAAGIFLKWLWEILMLKFMENFINDSKQNIRDLVLDSDHQAATWN